jgi:hypothetical protein
VPSCKTPAACSFPASCLTIITKELRDSTGALSSRVDWQQLAKSCRSEVHFDPGIQLREGAAKCIAREAFTPFLKAELIGNYF